ARGNQRLAVNTAAADPISLRQPVQHERLAGHGRRAVAGVHARDVGLIVAVEGCPALLERCVKPVELEPQSAAIVIRTVAKQCWDCVFVIRALYPGVDTAAMSGSALEAEIRNDARGGKQVQL